MENNDILQKRISKSGLSVYEFAFLFGVSPPTIYRYLNGQRKTPDWIKTVADDDDIFIAWENYKTKQVNNDNQP